MLEVNFNPFPELQTERLSLRRTCADDVNNLFELRSNEEVMKYIETGKALTTNDAIVHLEKIEDGLNSNSGISWAITLHNTPSQLIGVIGLWRLIKEHYRAEIGYTLLPQYWRKGIMAEAIKAVMEYGFSDMKLHSIEAQINPENIASAKLLESAGFIKEAHFKENFFAEGKFSDTIVYSKLL